MQLGSLFQAEIPILARLFDQADVTAKLPRLNEIFRQTEDLWEKNLARLSNIPVKYVVIGEAPPWSATGSISYLYDTDSQPRHSGGLFGRVYKGFFPTRKLSVEGYRNALDSIAKEGLLIVDSLPFAMNYQGKRDKVDYSLLIKSCSKTYLGRKLRRSRITWAENPKIAFSLLKNGRQIISSSPDGLPIGAKYQRVHVDESNIVVDGSGFPSPKAIRKLFDLHCAPQFVD